MGFSAAVWSGLGERLLEPETAWAGGLLYPLVTQPNRSWGDSVSLGEVGEPLALLQTSVPRPLHGQQRGTGLLPIAVIETTIKMLSREEFLSSYASRKQSIT